MSEILMGTAPSVDVEGSSYVNENASYMDEASDGEICRSFFGCPTGYKCQSPVGVAAFHNHRILDGVEVAARGSHLSLDDAEEIESPVAVDHQSLYRLVHVRLDLDLDPAQNVLSV